MFAIDETIAAIASPPGPAIRGIVRLSGPATVEIVDNVMDHAGPALSRAVRRCGQMDLGQPMGPIDASVLIWPTLRSYTGMPSAEIHLPGAQPILSAALDRILQSGARLAEPGEFTLRAFLAGRLDLTKAEAVLGVIDAEDRRSLEIALRQLSGGLSGPLDALRGDLIDLLAHLEAGLDFVEEDIEFITAAQLRGHIENITEQIDAIAQQMHFREGGSQIPQVVLRGQPNAGKSSLINALSSDNVAIVSEQPGTTRDTVETTVDLDGFPVRLIDTAGIEQGRGTIDTLSQQFAESAQTDADLVLLCIDVSSETLSAPQRSMLQDKHIIPVGTKLDQGLRLDEAREERWVLTSSRQGTGIAALGERICSELQSATAVESSTVNATAVRCRETLREANEALQRAGEVIDQSLGEELVACELRIALDALGRVTGAVYTDDILDRIFSQFCIGK